MNKTKVFYSSDMEDFFGICSRTFVRHLEKINNEHPDNIIAQRYLGDKWFLLKEDLPDFLNLCVKTKKNNHVNKLSIRTNNKMLSEENIIEEDRAYDAQLEEEADFIQDHHMEIENEILRGK